MLTLHSNDYEKVIPMVQSADINTLFALSVLKGIVDGKVYVDDEKAISSVYVQHPYGMALLCGEIHNEAFINQLSSYMLNKDKKRYQYEWLQVYPPSMNSIINEYIGNNLMKWKPDEPYIPTITTEEEGKILEFQRVNFRFNKEKFLKRKSNMPFKDCKIVRTSDSIYRQLSGAVIPKYFWNSSDNFVRNSIGFTLLINNQPVSTSFAAFIIDGKLEIGIETVKEQQGLGYADLVCISMIDYCLEHGYEPIWACSSSNKGSKKLALKLGFEETIRLPYYRLVK